MNDISRVTIRLTGAIANNGGLLSTFWLYVAELYSSNVT